MDGPEEHCSMDEEMLASWVVGHTITSVDVTSNTLTLDDGIQLTFKDDSDCCSWFEAELSNGNLVNNAVTQVVVTDYGESDYAPEGWTLHILAENEKICDLNIWGDSSSGYYLHSITLVVTPVEQSVPAPRLLGMS